MIAYQLQLPFIVTKSRRPKVGFCLFVLLIIGFIPVLGFAEIYRWVDSAGNIHYADRPEHQGAEKIEVNSTVTEAQRQDAQRISQQYQSLYQEFKRQDSARLAREQENAAEKKKREAACKKVQRLANVTNQDYALYKFNEHGSRAFLTDEEIAAYRAKISAVQSKHCSD